MVSVCLKTVLLLPYLKDPQLALAREQYLQSSIFNSGRVELCTELFYAIIPNLFPCFLLICYPYVHLVTFLMLFNRVYVTFCSKKYMLELKFLTYHRAANLSSQASSVDVCSIC